MNTKRDVRGEGTGFKKKHGEQKGELSVPARRFFQFYFDNLFWIGDFKPLAVALPAFGDDLDENFSHRSVRNVSDAVVIGFDIQFEFLVFAEFPLFDVFEIDTGVFDGKFGIATGNFNANAIALRCLG